MKFNVHMAPPTADDIENSNRDSLQIKAAVGGIIFIGAAIMAMSKYRFDLAILGAAVGWLVTMGLLSLMGLLESSSLKPVTDEELQEIVEISRRHESVLGYVRSTNQRHLVKGELNEFRRYDSSVQADVKPEEVEEDIDSVMKRIQQNTQ